MTQKEINKEILNKLYEVACKVFDEMPLPYGKYNSSTVFDPFIKIERELLSMIKDDEKKAKQKAYFPQSKALYAEAKKLRNDIREMWDNAMPNFESSITVDNFNCSFACGNIFKLVTKYERICNISAKNRKIFVKNEYNDPTCIPCF